MELEIAGQVRHPQVGEELRIPAGAVHSARNIDKTTARWLYGYKRALSETEVLLRSRRAASPRRRVLIPFDYHRGDSPSSSR